MPAQKVKKVEEGVKKAMELNDRIQVIFKELCGVPRYDRSFVIKSVIGLFGMDINDLE